MIRPMNASDINPYSLVFVVALVLFRQNKNKRGETILKKWKYGMNENEWNFIDYLVEHDRGSVLSKKTDSIWFFPCIFPKIFFPLFFVLFFKMHEWFLWPNFCYMSWKAAKKKKVAWISFGFSHLFRVCNTQNFEEKSVCIFCSFRHQFVM